MKTELSAGQAIYAMLSEALGEKVTKVFPVAAYDATLPYIVYGRTRLENTSAKGGNSAHAIMSVDVYAADYAESVEIAEKVRETLDLTHSKEVGDMHVRFCRLYDASETWIADAYCQSLSFDIAISY